MSLSEFIFSWVKDIALLFVIITLIELVMPKGSMKRYINFVVGLLIIFTVINPFVRLTKIDFQLERQVFKHIDEKLRYDEKILEGQENQIEGLYKERLAREIKTYIEDNSEERVAAVRLDIAKGEENFGKISSLKVILDHDREKDRDGKAIDIQVKPVILDHSPGLKDDEKYSHIKSMLAGYFELSEDIINISTMKMED